jgi:hypothetical protein
VPRGRAFDNVFAMGAEQRLNPVLRRLDALVGTWEDLVIDRREDPGKGRTTFEWLGGRAFVIQHSAVEPTDLP